MTSEEFDQALESLGLGTGEVAKEMAALGDSKTSASYVSAMRTGKKPVTQAAAIYVRLKMRGHNGEPAPVTQDQVLDWIKRHTK
jgi:hypothetical protein